MEIVGVAKDLREHTLSAPNTCGDVRAGRAGARRGDPHDHTYFPVGWVVRTDERLAGSSSQRSAKKCATLDPRQPITAVRSIDEIKARAMATETFQMTLLDGVCRPSACCSPPPASTA